jgi:hypothetical protein
MKAGPQGDSNSHNSANHSSRLVQLHFKTLTTENQHLYNQLKAVTEAQGQLKAVKEAQEKSTAAIEANVSGSKTPSL